MATLLGIKGVKGGDSVQGEEESVKHVDMPKSIPSKDPDLGSTEIKEPMLNGYSKISEYMERKNSDIDQKVEVRTNSSIYDFFTIDPTNDTIVKCIKCGRNRQREKLNFKDSVKYSNRGMISHLRLHEEEHDLWNASQSSQILKARKQNILGEKEEVLEQTEISHSEANLFGSISNQSVSIAFECIKEESVLPLTLESQEKKEFAMKLEKKKENIKNMKSENKKYKHARKSNSTVSFPCDYPNCGYRTNQYGNLMPHKKSMHEKRSVPLIC